MRIFFRFEYKMYFVIFAVSKYIFKLRLDLGSMENHFILYLKGRKIQSLDVLEVLMDSHLVSYEKF